MVLNGAAARFGLIATVAVIIVIGVIASLLKQPLPAEDTGPLAAFAPPMVVPSGTTGASAPLRAQDQAPPSTLPAGSVGTAAAAPEGLSSSEPSSPAPALPTAVATRSSDGSAPASTPPNPEALQPPPILPSAGTTRAQERAKHRHSKRVVRSRPAQHDHNEGVMAHWANRAPVSRPGSTPFSYDKQLGAQ
jgi:hypothetical protein